MLNDLQETQVLQMLWDETHNRFSHGRLLLHQM